MTNILPSDGGWRDPPIIVYQALNLVSRERYIGMTTQGLSTRVRGHKRDAKTGTNRFYKAIRQYGFDAFFFSIIDMCETKEEALRIELERIAQMSPAYNTAAGGLRGAQGWKHTEETRRKMSEMRHGKPGPWLGKKRSASSIAKRTATRSLNPVRTWLGKKRSPETIAKIIASRPFLPKPPRPSGLRLERCRENMRNANERRKKKVRCITHDKIFDSIRTAARHYGLAKSHLTRCCNGVCGNAHGLEFEFVS
jgi:group I intron endonuclease